MRDRILHDYGTGTRPDTSILDFGFGWGRIIRFLRKDFDPRLTFGVDVQESVLAAAIRDVPDCNFQKIGAYPPIPFDNDQFDPIYAYSVFSRLPVNIKKHWVKEFARILAPGGFALRHH